MARLKWDQTGERFYETGADHGVLYVRGSAGYTPGVEWNGLTGVTENPSGAEMTDLYADNLKYLSIMSAEQFGCTIEAYTYPDEFMVCDGTASIADGVYAHQQPRKNFGLSYRTLLGNDVDSQDHGFKLHLVYGCLAKPSQKGYKTVNASPEAVTFSWEVSTTPVDPGNENVKPTAKLTINSTKVDPEKLKKLMDILYGMDEHEDGGGQTVPATEPRLPLPAEVAQIIGTVPTP